MFRSLAHFLALSPVLVLAKVVRYDWTTTWLNRAPDGHSRPVIGINDQWPCPPIEVDLGDTIEICLKNGLRNETTSLHFHGIYQTGSTEMDGPSGVTQCPIPPGESFTYRFKADAPGTYWYHSHTGGQYPDGLRAPLIVRDKHAPFDYDKEITITVSDWYRDEMPNLIHYYQSKANQDDKDGAEPIPDSCLINDAQNSEIHVNHNKKYLVRLANMGAFAGQFFAIDGHDLIIVEADGVYVKPYTVSSIYVTVAQRYSFILCPRKGVNTKGRNFAILASMDEGMFDSVPDGLDNNATAYLVYNSRKALPAKLEVEKFEMLDDTKLEPVHPTHLGAPDYEIHMTMDFTAIDGIQRAIINDVTNIPQKVPTLYTTLSAPKSLVSDPTIYGKHSNAWVLEHNQVVEIVLNNHDDGGHPWHLHGHKFQIMKRAEENAGDFDPKNPGYITGVPMERDTVMVHASSHVVIRFKADNPGIQLFHCHIEWHVSAGLTATLIEAPQQLLGLHIPEDHLHACKVQGIPTKGNAAGNTKNYKDLTGERTDPMHEAWGALIVGKHPM